MDLEAYRKQLNEIDDTLAALFCRRMEIVAAIAAYKQANHLPVLDLSREAAVVKRLTETQEFCYTESIATLYEIIFALRRSYQQALQEKSERQNPIGNAEEQLVKPQDVTEEKQPQQENSEQTEAAERPKQTNRKESVTKEEQYPADKKAQYGLLGYHSHHSHSPMIHNQLAEYGYQLFDIVPEQLAEFLKQKEFRGLNVTIPYKQSVMEFCQEVSPLAQRINGVNTIYRREDGSLYGHNTCLLYTSPSPRDG